ncbi:hypothetical protein [Streptomyces sp. CA-253872]
MPAQSTPAPGRIVHYVSHGTPLSAGGTLHAPADARAGGSWHWPEVVQ